MKQYDAIILGAGGAGLMCGIHAGRREKKVLIIEHSQKIGGKILISGGGRCNFTNFGTTPENFQSENASFCKTALAKYKPQDFIEMVKNHGIIFYEKKLGQLFCRNSAKEIVKMLELECDKSEVEILRETEITGVDSIKSTNRADPRFVVNTSNGGFCSNNLVIATGGYSFPKIGATGLGYEIAKQFGHRITETAPALDGFVFTDHQTKKFADLAGVSLDCFMECDGKSFRENLLFTHLGISGPAALQCSLHWRPGMNISIDLLPERDFYLIATELRKKAPKSTLKNLLQEFLVTRFVDLFCEIYLESFSPALKDQSDRDIRLISDLLHRWTIKPSSTVGYHKAEVTRGGVDTNELSARTMQSKILPGLFFIGEVVDVTGWLGGYNFQWAWASGWSAAQAL